MVLLLRFSRIHIPHLCSLEDEKLVGLGQRLQGGAGHYEWFSLDGWDKDTSEAEKTRINKVEGTVSNNVLLLPKKESLPKIKRDDSSSESFEDYKPNKSIREKPFVLKSKTEVKAKNNAQTKVQIKELSVPKEKKQEQRAKAIITNNKVFTSNAKPRKDNIKKNTLSQKDSTRQETSSKVKEIKPKVILAPILTPLVEFNKVWIKSNLAGVKVLLVDLNSIKAPIDIWKQRMEILTSLVKQADYVFITGTQDVSNYARPYMKKLNIEIMVSKVAMVSNKYLIGEVAKLKEEKLQMVVFTNIHALSQLSSKGRLTIVSPKVETMSRVLAENADAILDLNLTEVEIFRKDKVEENITPNYTQHQIRKETKIITSDKRKKTKKQKRSFSKS